MKLRILGRYPFSMDSFSSSGINGNERVDNLAGRANFRGLTLASRIVYWWNSVFNKEESIRSGTIRGIYPMLTKGDIFSKCLQESRYSQPWFERYITCSEKYLCILIGWDLGTRRLPSICIGLLSETTLSVDVIRTTGGTLTMAFLLGCELSRRKIARFYDKVRGKIEFPTNATILLACLSEGGNLGSWFSNSLYNWAVIFFEEMLMW